MALVNCPECQKEVSDTAKICPHCGYKIKKKVSVFKLLDNTTNYIVGVMLDLGQYLGHKKLNFSPA